MSWIPLIAAGLLDVVRTLAMKQSLGVTRLPPTLIMLLAMAGSFGLLRLAMRTCRSAPPA